MQPNDKPLQPMEARFAHEYVVDFNGTAAAKRAGYAEKSAAGQATRLLKRAHVAAKISELMAARNEAAQVDAAYVMRELKRVYETAMADIRPALDRKGKPRKDPETGEPLYIVNLTAANKALELLGRLAKVGAFEDKVAIKGEISLVERLQAGRRRAALANAEVIDVEAEDVTPLQAQGSQSVALVERLEAGRRRGRPQASYAPLADARVEMKGSR